MSSSVIDLGSSGVHLPEHLGLDTNVLATRFVLPARITAGDAARRARVRAVFTAFRAQRVAGVATAIVLMERIHVAIKSKYIADLPAYALIIGGRRSWELLYKARPDLIQTYRPHLRRLLRSLRVSGLTSSTRRTSNHLAKAGASRMDCSTSSSGTNSTHEPPPSSSNCNGPA